MNAKNHDLFFNENSEYSVTITITDENGVDEEAEIIASIEIEELGREFVAVLPLSQNENEEMEAMILEYSEDENGEPVFAGVDDEEILGLAADAFNQFFADEAEDDDDEEGGDFLGDIGNIIPGVSIKRD